MAHQVDAPGGAGGPVAEPAAAGRRWYSRPPEEVAEALGVQVSAGLTAARAAELLSANGPNALAP